MFDLKLIRIASEIYRDTLSNSSADTLRFMAHLTERVGALSETSRIALQQAIEKAYDEITS